MATAVLEKPRQPRSPDLSDIEMELQCQLSGWVRDLEIVRCGKGLILRGHASKYYGKQMAQQKVMEATRIPIVANEIEVL